MTHNTEGCVFNWHRGWQRQRLVGVHVWDVALVGHNLAC